MESGSITTQRCPFLSFLATLTAAATALPLEPPVNKGNISNSNALPCIVCKSILLNFPLSLLHYTTEGVLTFQLIDWFHCFSEEHVNQTLAKKTSDIPYLPLLYTQKHASITRSTRPHS